MQLIYYDLFRLLYLYLPTSLSNTVEQVRTVNGLTRLVLPVLVVRQGDGQNTDPQSMVRKPRGATVHFCFSVFSFLLFNFLVFHFINFGGILVPWTTPMDYTQLDDPKMDYT